MNADQVSHRVRVIHLKLDQVLAEYDDMLDTATEEDAENDTAQAAKVVKLIGANERTAIEAVCARCKAIDDKIVAQQQTVTIWD